MLHLFIVLISAAIGFGSAWYIQDAEFTKQITSIKDEHTIAMDSIKDLASEQLIEMTRKHKEALQNATTRHAQLSKDVVNSTNALIRLSNATEEAVRSARSSADACNATVDTFRIVFNDCSAKYERMGRDAQGHVIDKQTLIDSYNTKGE